MDATSSTFSAPFDSPLTPQFLAGYHEFAVRVPVRKALYVCYSRVSFVPPSGKVIRRHPNDSPA